MSDSNDYILDQKCIEHIQDFSSLAYSLKNVGKDNLKKDKDLIEKLYVDPYNHENALVQLLKDHTTFIIGKTGSGKSTIVSRFINEIEKMDDKIAVYVDTKSIFDEIITSVEFDVTEEIERVLIYEKFVTTIIEKILNITSQNRKISKYRKKEKISELVRDFERSKLSLNAMNNIKRKEKEDQHLQKHIKGELGAGLKKKVSIHSSVSGDLKRSEQESIEKEFDELVLHYLRPREVFKKLEEILKECKVSRFFICLDDFSDISEGMMVLFFDSFISVINSDAENFFKFKIASYPGRIYYGAGTTKIPVAKIKKLFLDYSDRYENTPDIGELSIIKLNEILKRRVDYFIEKDFDFSNFFFIDDNNSKEEYYEELFSMTFNVYRNLGNILDLLHERCIVNEKKITFDDLDRVSYEYFNDIAEDFFSSNNKKLMSFDEILSSFQLKELFQIITDKAKQLNDQFYNDGDDDEIVFPSNIFFIEKSFARYLQSLELNFLIYKLREIPIDENTIYVFYTINMAFCLRKGIKFKLIAKSRYSQIIMNNKKQEYTEIIRDYLYSMKVYRCSMEDCQYTLSLKEKKSLEMFDYCCPKCRKGIMHIDQKIT